MSFSGGERNQLFLNRQGLEFDTLSGVSGVDIADDARGFAYLDYDHDGWLDLALMTRDSPSMQLFRNQLADRVPEHRSVAIRFVGGNRSAQAANGLSARDGIGAQAILELEGTTLRRELRAGEGWRTQNSSALVIGIGSAEVVQRLTISWPSGKTQALPEVPAGVLVTAYENADESPDGSGFALASYGPGPELSSDVESGEQDSRGASLALMDPLARSAGEFPLAPAASEAPLAMYTSMATWCPACKRELGNLKRLRAAIPANRLAMFGVPIDLDEDEALLLKYAESNQTPYELLADLSAEERTAFQQFVFETLHTEALPTTVIVASDGTAISVIPGTPTLSDVLSVLEGLEAAAR